MTVEDSSIHKYQVHGEQQVLVRLNLGLLEALYVLAILSKIYVLSNEKKYFGGSDSEPVILSLIHI